MAISDRYNLTADIMGITQVDDTKGGLKDAAVARALAVGFFRFDPKQFALEALITRFGLEPNAVLYCAETEESNGSLIQNNDILEVSATEQYRVYSVKPVYGGDGTVRHYTLDIAPARKTI